MRRAWGRVGPTSSSLLELFPRVLVCRVGVQGFKGTLADRYGSQILEDTLGTGDPFGGYVTAAFSLQGIFPDPWCARAGPLMPKVGRKCCHSWLAGGIFRYGSKYGPRLVDSTEVANMKRIP